MSDNPKKIKIMRHEKKHPITFLPADIWAYIIETKIREWEKLSDAIGSIVLVGSHQVHSISHLITEITALLRTFEEESLFPDILDSNGKYKSMWASLKRLDFRDTPEFGWAYIKRLWKTCYCCWGYICKYEYVTKVSTHCEVWMKILGAPSDYNICCHCLDIFPEYSIPESRLAKWNLPLDVIRMSQIKRICITERDPRTGEEYESVAYMPYTFFLFCLSPHIYRPLLLTNKIQTRSILRKRNQLVCQINGLFTEMYAELQEVEITRKKQNGMLTKEEEIELKIIQNFKEWKKRLNISKKDVDKKRRKIREIIDS